MLTDKQISALRYLIFKSKDGNELTKKILAFLVEQSHGLSEEVCLTLVEDREGYTAEEIRDAAVGVDEMLSSNRRTHLHEILQAMGRNFRFCIHYGDYDPTRDGDPFNSDGQFAGATKEQVGGEVNLLREGMPIRFTFWCAKDFYSRTAKLVKVTREFLDQIDIAKPGLYPALEPA